MKFAVVFISVLCVGTSFFFDGFANLVHSEYLDDVSHLSLTPAPEPSPSYDPQDDLIGICPAEVFAALGACVCNAIFMGELKTISPSNKVTEANCLLNYGREQEILKLDGFCIPFRNRKGVLNKGKLIKLLNFFLKRCQAGYTLKAN